jgi:predicted nucleic acid-binding protein
MVNTARLVFLDAEAVSRLAERDPQMQAWAVALRKRRRHFQVSAVTLAEVSAGSDRDGNLGRVLKDATLHDVTPEIGHAAGAMRARVGRRKQRDLAVDAVVAATAASLPGPVLVLTADPDDLTALLAGTDVRVAPIS